MKIFTIHITLFFQFLVYVSFAQKLEVEAVYFDEDSVMYKLEQKYYINDSTNLYIRHTQKFSVGIETITQFIDTSLQVTENYYYINFKKNRLTLLQESNISILEGTYESPDYIHLKAIQYNNSTESDTTLLDTILYGKNIANNWHKTIPNRVEELFVGKDSFDINNKVLQEHFIIRYDSNNFPLLYNYSSNRNEYTIHFTGIKNGNSIIYSGDFNDTVIWNNEETIISFNNMYSQNKAERYTYYITNNERHWLYQDSIKLSSTYLKCNSILKQTILNERFYFDPMFSIQLQTDEKYLILKTNTINRNLYENKYEFNNENKVIKVTNFLNGKFWGYCEYRYY